ncbi:MAG TPA: glycosyltransferase, partial [Allocoleopsis sp.]
PLYLTNYMTTPIAHLISMSSLTNVMDREIENVINKFPGTVAVLTKTQASSFTFGDKMICIPNGIDISQYNFCQNPDSSLAWSGRISPEKGLEDAFAAAEITQIPLKIFGFKQDENYWNKINQDYPNAPVEYRGFLSTSQLQNELGKCRGLLVTPRWIEAFGNVALEAFACGVPLITYQRGGLSEIVENGKTGWLVEPDSVSGLVEAISKLDQINRFSCRQQAESQYSLKAMGLRLENWFEDILKNFSNQE